MKLSAWRSPDAEQRFRAVEDELWDELCARPRDEIDVDTTFGRTRVYHWNGADPPVVFLHGLGGTSLMWAQYVDSLVGRAMYAVDTIGDVGRSVPCVPIERARDLARWLGETLDRVGLERVHLVGCSYGGFVALHFAAG